MEEAVILRIEVYSTYDTSEPKDRETKEYA